MILYSLLTDAAARTVSVKTEKRINIVKL